VSCALDAVGRTAKKQIAAKWDAKRRTDRVLSEYRLRIDANSLIILPHSVDLFLGVDN
jgi:hypothetical protein